MTAHDLEPLLVDMWPARERATLHGWRLGADAGVTGRANCVAPFSFTGSDVEAAIDEAVAWQKARATRSCFRIAEGCCAPGDLPARLAARGWTAHGPTLVMTAPVADALSRLPAAGHCALTAGYPPQVDAVLRETSASDAEWSERAGLAQRTPAPRRFALVDDGAATGLCVVADGWAGIFLMRTHPARRRQGLARQVLADLIAWSRSAGASRLFLQVEADNAPAVALYRDAAFETAYSYSYWRPETGT